MDDNDRRWAGHVETDERPLEATRLTPHIEKTSLGQRLIPDEPKKPAIDVGPMPGEQGLHRWFAASGDLFNQDLVG